MTTIAKIFIVVNFLLSVFFVGIAATVLHKTDEYRTLYDGEVMAKNQLEQDKNAEIDVLNGKNEKLNDDKSKLSSERDGLVAEKERLTQDQNQLRNEMRNINGTKDRLSTTVESMRSQLAEFETYVKSIQGEKDDSAQKMNDAMEAQRVAENEQRRLSDQLGEERSLTADLQKNIENLQARVDEWEMINKYWLDAKGLNLQESLATVPPINGRIASVKDNLGFVILSVGANDSVKVGYTFVVSRGDEYIGDVTVDQVEDNSSSARISFTKRGAQMRVSDEVTTKL